MWKLILKSLSIFEIFVVTFLVLSLGNVMCILHFQHISIRTCGQWLHYWTARLSTVLPPGFFRAWACPQTSPPKKTSCLIPYTPFTVQQPPPQISRMSKPKCSVHGYLFLLTLVTFIDFKSKMARLLGSRTGGKGHAGKGQGQRPWKTGPVWGSVSTTLSAKLQTHWQLDISFHNHIILSTCRDTLDPSHSPWTEISLPHFHSFAKIIVELQKKDWSLGSHEKRHAPTTEPPIGKSDE